MAHSCDPSIWESEVTGLLQVKASLGYAVKPFLKQTAATKYLFPMLSILRGPRAIG